MSDSTPIETAVAILRARTPRNGVTDAELGRFSEPVRACQDAQAEGGDEGWDRAWEAIRGSYEELAARVDGTRADGSSERFELLRYADALEARPAKTPVVDGMLFDSSLVCFFGAGGSKKTWLCLDLMAAVVLGIPWLGRQTTQCPVLMVEEESGNRRLLDRMQAIGAARHLPSDAPMYAVSLSMVNLYRDSADADALEALILDLSVGLVVIDSLSMVAGEADENATGEMGIVMQRLRRIAERTGAAIVLIHHANRSGSYRGASKIRDSLDLALQIESKQESPFVEITTDKARDVAAFRLRAHLRFENGDDGTAAKVFVSRAEPATNEPKLGVGEQYVIRYLRENGPSKTGKITTNALPSCAPSTARTGVHPVSETHR